MKSKLKQITLWLCLGLAVLIVSARVQAAAVKSAKGSKVLLLLKFEEVRRPGETLLVIDRTNGRRATMIVTSVTGRQAIAELQSGDVEVGDIALPFNAKRTETFAARPKALPSASKKESKTKLHAVWSVFAGYSQQYQTVKLTSAAQVALSGRSFFLRGSYYDHFRSPKYLSWEAGAGLDQLNTSGSLSTGACNGFQSSTQDCSYQTLSLSPFGRIGYVFPFLDELEEHQVQVRLGTDLLIPFSIQSNVVDQSPYVPLVFLTAGVAAHIVFDEDVIIPIGFDYGYYVGNANVTMYRLMIYGGYSWR